MLVNNFTIRKKTLKVLEIYVYNMDDSSQSQSVKITADPTMPNATYIGEIQGDYNLTVKFKDRLADAFAYLWNVKASSVKVVLEKE